MSITRLSVPSLVVDIAVIKALVGFLHTGRDGNI
jgi:hypothetical protein